MEKLYVTLKEQTETVRNPDGTYQMDSQGKFIQKQLPPLGYAARYNPGTKCDKKNDDQRQWVQVPSSPAKLQPLIIENVAIEGFKITDFATRYSTSNKLIRILDPRGFELEISVANLLEILDQTTVTNSNFIGKYKWDFGKNGIGKAKLVKE